MTRGRRRRGIWIFEIRPARERERDRERKRERKKESHLEYPEAGS